MTSAGRPAVPLLAHRIDGDGEPIVLLNGGMMSISAWEPIAAVLARQFRVVRCDFRGQLLSPADAPSELSGHVDDLITLLDHLELSRVHLVGTSFGAQVALLAAATHDARVSSLIAAAAVDFVPPSMLAIGSELGSAARRAATGTDRGAFFDLLARVVYSEGYRRKHTGDLAERNRQLVALPASWFAGVERILAAIGSADLRPLLAAIRCPTLVVMADGDALMPAERSRAVAAAIPGAGVEIVHGSGHALVVEKEPEFIDIVERHVRRHCVGRGVLGSA